MPGICTLSNKNISICKKSIFCSFQWTPLSETFREKNVKRKDYLRTSGVGVGGSCRFLIQAINKRFWTKCVSTRYIFFYKSERRWDRNITCTWTCILIYNAHTFLKFIKPVEFFFNRSDKYNTHFPSCYCFKWAYREVTLIPCISLVDLCKCNVEVLEFMFQIK